MPAARTFGGLLQPVRLPMREMFRNRKGSEVTVGVLATMYLYGLACFVGGLAIGYAWRDGKWGE